MNNTYSDMLKYVDEFLREKSSLSGNETLQQLANLEQKKKALKDNLAQMGILSNTTEQLIDTAGSKYYSNSTG